MPTSAGFADSVEQALTASSNPRIANPAIMANFCCLDQDESSFPEIVLLLGCLLDSLSSDFHVVVILSPPLRLAQSVEEKQEVVQWSAH